MRRVTILHFALTAAIPLASPACRSGRSHDASPSPQPRDAPHILSQAQLQAAIDVFVCAQWSAEANEWSLELFREDCSAREGAVPVCQAELSAGPEATVHRASRGEFAL
jgi:hypothetical protein